MPSWGKGEWGETFKEADASTVVKSKTRLSLLGFGGISNCASVSLCTFIGGKRWGPKGFGTGLTLRLTDR